MLTSLTRYMISQSFYSSREVFKACCMIRNCHDVGRSHSRIELQRKHHNDVIEWEIFEKAFSWSQCLLYVKWSKRSNRKVHASVEEPSTLVKTQWESISGIRTRHQEVYDAPSQPDCSIDNLGRPETYLITYSFHMLFYQLSLIQSRVFDWLMNSDQTLKAITVDEL